MITSTFEFYLKKKYIRNVLLYLAFFGFISSIVSSLLNLSEIYQHDHHSRSLPLSQTQLNQVYVFSMFNLVWVSVLVPLYIILTWQRREHFTPLILVLSILCHFIRTMLFVTLTDPIDGKFSHFLAYFSIAWEIVAIILIPTTWLAGCFI